MKILRIILNVLFVLTSPIWVLPFMGVAFAFSREYEAQRRGEALFL